MDFKVIFLTENFKSLPKETVNEIIVKHFGSSIYLKELHDELISLKIIDENNNVNVQILEDFLKRKVSEKMNKVKSLITKNDYWRAFCEMNARDYVFLVETVYGYEKLNEISMYHQIKNWKKSYYFVDAAICNDGAGM